MLSSRRRALRAAAVRVLTAVEHLEQRFDGANRRVVVVLADRRHRFRACAWRPRCPGTSARRTISSTIASTSSKSSDEAGARHDSRVARGRRRAATRRGRRAPRRSRRPSRVSCLDRAHGRAGRRGPADRRARSRPPARTVALMVTAGVIDVSCDDDHSAVVEQRRCGPATGPLATVGGHDGRPSGRNHPTVRVAAPRRRRATSETCSAVTASPRLQLGQEPGPRDRLEVSELVRDVGHAVVLEDEPRAQLTAGARDSSSLDAVCSRIRSISSRAAASSVSERDALNRRQRHRIEERLGGRQQRPPTRDASAPSTSAV